MAHLDLPIGCEIFFNGQPYTRVQILQSAQKHFRSKSSSIILYIAHSLDGQNRTPDKLDSNGKEIYRLVSHIDTAGVPSALSQWRDSLFHTNPGTGTLTFIHCSPQRERQYENSSEKTKLRLT